MHGFLMILLVYHILPQSLSVSAIQEIDRNSAEIKLKDVNLNRRKLPIFPKNTNKFVVTPTPPTHTAYSYKPKEKIMAKMPLIPQMKLKSRYETSTITPAKRKPLMKLRAFTMTSRTTAKINSNQHSHNNGNAINKDETQIGINTRIDSVTEQQNYTEVYVPEESQISVNFRRINKIDYKSQNKHGKESVKTKDNFLYEEEQDRSEFIFLKNEDQDQVDMQDNVGQEFQDDAETTTELQITKKMERVKRSKNIIEEENMASTVTGFKYTGRDTRLNNNFYFKNINS